MTPVWIYGRILCGLVELWCCRNPVGPWDVRGHGGNRMTSRVDEMTAPSNARDPWLLFAARPRRVLPRPYLSAARSAGVAASRLSPSPPVMSNKSVPISVDGGGQQASNGFRLAEWRWRPGTSSPGSDIDARWRRRRHGAPSDLVLTDHRQDLITTTRHIHATDFTVSVHEKTDFPDVTSCILL